MQPVFSRNDRVGKMAFLNWRIKRDDEITNMLMLAEGFLLSSIMLSQQCLVDNSDKKANIVIFPILTNANHGIELYLKAILWTLNKLLDSSLRIEGKHNIKQIFETVRAKVKVYKGNMSLKDFDAETVCLKSYIEELFEKINATPKDDKMDFSRYPLSDKYENHFYVDVIGNVEVDLENFVIQFEKIKEGLERVSDFLYYRELCREDEW